MKTGLIIKELRIKKGLTQEELAFKTELSTRTIQRIESGEVDPRSYTLQMIAKALEVEYETLAGNEGNNNSNDQQNRKWLPLMHLSGLLILILPPIVLWIVKKDEVKGLNKHAIEVINYQLTLQLLALPLMLMTLYPFVIILFVYSQIVIIMNTMKVAAGKDFKYPWNIRFFKSGEDKQLSVS